jgi:hypothetical protein
MGQTPVVLVFGNGVCPLGLIAACRSTNDIFFKRLSPRCRLTYPACKQEKKNAFFVIPATCGELVEPSGGDRSLWGFLIPQQFLFQK